MTTLESKQINENIDVGNLNNLTPNQKQKVADRVNLDPYIKNSSETQDRKENSEIKNIHESRKEVPMNFLKITDRNDIKKMVQNKELTTKLLNIDEYMSKDMDLHKLFKEYLGLSVGNNGEGQKISDIEIQSILKDGETIKLKTIPLDKGLLQQNQKDIIADLEKYYPGSEIGINGNGTALNITYSQGSIARAIKKAFDNQYDNKFASDIKTVNSRASTDSDKLADGMIDNVVTINDNYTKEVMSKISNEMRTKHPGDVRTTLPDGSQISIPMQKYYDKINAINRNNMNKSLDGKTVKDIKNLSYEETKDERINNFNRIVNYADAQTAGTGINARTISSVFGNKSENVEATNIRWLNKTSEEITKIKGQVFELVKENGEMHLKTYSLDKNSYIDYLNSQPKEMKDIEDNLKNSLKNEEININNTLKKEYEKIKNVDINNEKQVLNLINSFDVSIQNINDIITKFQEFHIDISNANDLNMLKNPQTRDAALKERDLHIDLYKQNVLKKFEDMKDNLQKKVEEYKELQEAIKNNAIYNKIINGEQLTNGEDISNEELIIRLIAENGKKVDNSQKLPNKELLKLNPGEVKKYEIDRRNTNGFGTFDNFIIEGKSDGKPILTKYRESNVPYGDQKQTFWRNGQNVSKTTYSGELNKFSQLSQTFKNDINTDIDLNKFDFGKTEQDIVQKNEIYNKLIKGEKISPEEQEKINNNDIIVRLISNNGEEVNNSKTKPNQDAIANFDVSKEKIFQKSYTKSNGDKITDIYVISTNNNGGLKLTKHKENITPYGGKFYFEDGRNVSASNFNKLKKTNILNPQEDIQNEELLTNKGNTNVNQRAGD